MGLVPDQGSVEEFGPARADPAPHDCVHAGHHDSGPHDLDAFGRQDSVEAGRVAVAVPDQVFDLRSAVLDVHGEVPCDLGDPVRGRTCRGAEDPHAAGGVLDHRQHGQGRAGEGLGSEEVGGQDGVGLGTEEGGPGGGAFPLEWPPLPPVMMERIRRRPVRPSKQPELSDARSTGIEGTGRYMAVTQKETHPPARPARSGNLQVRGYSRRRGEDRSSQLPRSCARTPERTAFVRRFGSHEDLSRESNCSPFAAAPTGSTHRVALVCRDVPRMSGSRPAGRARKA